jgi:hypothetical protein
VFTGSAVSGGAAQLASRDGSAYVVSGPGRTSWYGQLSGVPNALRTLSVTYAGSQSTSCTQVLWVWNWSAGTWAALDSRAAGTTSQEVSGTNSSSPGSYVSGSSGNGDMYVAVTCDRSDGASVTTSGDLMRVTYTQ